MLQPSRTLNGYYQETVAHLGELDAQGRADAKALALQLTGRAEQTELVEPATPPAGKVQVRLDGIRLERARSFGDVWLGWTLWRALQLDQLCADHLPQGCEQVPWATMAAILVIARLCDPSCELHIAQDWYRRTALQDLLGVPAERVNDDRLYARWTSSCRTKRHWRRTCAVALESCSLWTTTCSCTT